MPNNSHTECPAITHHTWKCTESHKSECSLSDDIVIHLSNFNFPSSVLLFQYFLRQFNTLQRHGNATLKKDSLPEDLAVHLLKQVSSMSNKNQPVTLKSICYTDIKTLMK